MLERNTQEWGYRTLPNKMYELVKNTGDMERIGTGYYTDSESELLLILAYLNYGETTNITESMMEQIREATKNAGNQHIGEVTMNDFTGGLGLDF